MRFFLDNCVPESVGRTLIDAKHEVIFQRQVIARDAPDPLVAVASAGNDAILVSFDKDFGAIASRFAVSQRRLKRLSRIHFRCDERQAARRIAEALTLIEAEWRIAQESPDKRMFIEIQGNAIKMIR